MFILLSRHGRKPEMKNKKHEKRQNRAVPYLFIAPHLILFCVFFLIPLFYGIYASFTNWNLFSAPKWIGLENYRTILFDTSSTFFRQFWNGLRNTVLFVVLCVPVQIILPLVISLLLYTKPRGADIFRSIFYMPTLLSITSVTLTWLFIFNRSLGLLNHLFSIDTNWYGEQPYAWITILVTTWWWCMGTNMVIYVAALGGIDKSVIDASRIDGASGWYQMWYILLPSIRFSLTYTIVVTIISQFNIYGQPLILTGGGPKESTAVLLMYIRNIAFGTGRPIAGTASAMAVILGLIIGVVSLAQLKLMSGKEDA